MFRYNFKKSRNFWIPLSCGIFLVALLLFLVVSRDSRSQSTDGNTPTSTTAVVSYPYVWNPQTSVWDRVVANPTAGIAISTGIPAVGLMINNSASGNTFIPLRSSATSGDAQG